MADNSAFDPFQVFEVSHKHCAKVIVKVIRGRTITKGSWTKDLMDIPDPYVILTLANAPHSWRKTTVKDNDVNPVWEEEFTFFVDPDQEHTLEMSLMDANYTQDEHLATRSLSLTPLPLEKTLRETIHFNQTSEVDIEVSAHVCEQADLRYSLTLCQEEKDFIDSRKRRVHKAMKNHFGFGAPRNYKEVPVIAVIGSGGGFRAMTAFSGAFSALAELGVLDMTTYVAGLSGSAWYVSQLYSHPEWPHQLSPAVQRDHLKVSIDHSFLWLFQSHSISFAKQVWRKRSRGEPVSFTDLFGHLVGNTIISDRLDSKLSDQRRTVEKGQCPLPLYTCLHVKKSVSAMVFHEWMEFSPFEVGLAKYGTFMKSEQFACKFFMGSIVRHFPEPPLHFLQGIWGSAFCIQFKRLFQDDKNVDTVELMRREREELQQELFKDMAKYDAEDSESSDDEEKTAAEKGTHGEKTTGGLQRKRSKSTKMKQKTFWESVMQKMMESSWFQTIELRAAQVFNFMRGLSLNNVYPFSPFTQTQEEEDENNRCTFGSIFQMHPTSVKKLYVVDSGLTFNSPFPVVLRPQREVDIILSFDFSARPSDDTPPFKELLLAAKWAELNKVPFPPIDPKIVEKEGLKECYVFKHPWDPNCPIVLHFCLININFRREISPGVPRTTQEEIDFGNFSIFDDPAHPYSTFKFTYKHLEFDRLSKLVEYNTLRNQELIFDNISTCVKRRRRFSIRRPCSVKDISRLSLKSRTKVQQLEKYIAMVEKITGGGSSEEKLEDNNNSSNGGGGHAPLSTTMSSIPDGGSGDAHRLSVKSRSLMTNGRNQMRRGSKEEADLPTKGRIPRPVSSPVRFLQEVQEEQRQAAAAAVLAGGEVTLRGGNRPRLARGEEFFKVSDDENEDQEEVISPKLSRSPVSLKSPRTRNRLSSAMSRLDEADDEEEEEKVESAIATPTISGVSLVEEDTKSTSSRGVLTRSRPVSASKRPNIRSERLASSDPSIDEDEYFPAQQAEGEASKEDLKDSPDRHLINGNNHSKNGGGDFLKPSDTELDSDLPPLSPRLSRRANALTPGQKKANSIDRQLSNSSADSLTQNFSATSLSENNNNKRGSRKRDGKTSGDLAEKSSGPTPETLDEWFDSQEQVTEL